jgi:hypothetical protein
VSSTDRLRNLVPGRTFLVHEGEMRPREIAPTRRHSLKRVNGRVVVAPKRRLGVPLPALAPASPLQEYPGSVGGFGLRPGTGGDREGAVC